MPIQLLIPGSKLDPSAARGVVRGGSAAGPPAMDSALLACVETVAAFNVAQVSRAADAKVESLELRDDDIVEVEFENGFKLYASAEKYLEDMQRYAPQSISRDGIPWRPIPRQSGAERGLRDFGEKVLRVLRLKADSFVQDAADPKKWPRYLQELAAKAGVKAGAWLTIRALTWLLENQLQPGPGLYRWPIVGGIPTLDFKNLTPIPSLPDTGAPLLICIHGTASSTLGSFSRLLVRSANAGHYEPQREWVRIQQMFGDNVFAFEHRSLSQSPIENALQLAETLPQGAKVRLLSHSRGGLVGDLLCLPQIPAEMIKGFRRAEGDALDAMDTFDQEQLAKLSDILREKQLDITHFARVACPARGTLLASENIETFLSGLTSLIGFIPGVGTSVTYEVIKRVTLEVAKSRANASWIPGIEAMVPDSPLVRMLNTIEAGLPGGDAATASPLRAKGNLGVVAGDSQGGGIGHFLVTKVADWFVHSGRDNDWVVNTDSMYEGAPRDPNAAHYVLDQGGDVSHFQYFANDRTREAVIDWLTNVTASPPGAFAPIVRQRPARPMPRSVRSATGPRPIVFMLPGIMGSGLQVGAEAVWLNYWKMASGGLKKLQDVDSAAVVATEPLEEYYGEFCEYLGQAHDVMRYAYDWRQSINVSARKLAADVRNLLANVGGRPVRFVAHSMGGLVARGMIQAEPKLWAELCAKHDSRLLMLGTPNDGSNAIIETMTGFDKLVRQLALLDLRHDTQAVLDIVSGFPGVLELMPPDDTLFMRETWEKYRAANRKLGAIPSVARLLDAKTVIQNRDPKIPHADRVAYVAGSAPRTVTGAQIVNGRLVLETTEFGDGRVTHKSSQLPDVEMWYVDSDHGGLPSHIDAFEGYEELLDTGRTQRLSRAPIASRGGAPAAITEPPLVLFPTRSDLIDGAMGRGAGPGRKVTTRPLTVEVVHGDVRYARYPVMVGHFADDTISGPEAVLDAKLDGMLSQRHRFNVYPGPKGTVFTALPKPNSLATQTNDRRGAVIIGLGGLDDLSPGVLANSIRDGVLDYALETAALLGLASNGESTRQGIGLSIVLIGSASAAKMSVEESVSSILRGVAAARRDVERSQCPVVVDKLEIIELYADAAIDAARAISRMAAAIGRELEVRIEFPERVKEVQGRRQRLWSRGGSDVWRRWVITAKRSKRAAQAVSELPPVLSARLRACLGQFDTLDQATFQALLDMAIPGPQSIKAESIGLKFVAMSDRARAERTTQAFQPELIDDMVRESIRDTRYRQEQAKSLGTLLVPNDLKDNILHNSRLVLVVDQDTANYPWELMILSDKPLAIQLPLIRQLETSRYRRQLRAATGRSAYVVGEPKTMPGVSPLPAAKAEAEQVARMLADKGYEVDARHDSPTANQVLEGLFARPYRIVHLAGHGFFEDAATTSAKARCGMLLDNGRFLTAVEISQMPQLPHLVFLNCCHLGRTSPAESQPFVPYNKLAASISQELIVMGVNAVIAAGWAVRDDAAELFAKVFYESILSGRKFGDSVNEARQAVFARFRDCNTWGAYQAYGDPDFRLTSNLGEDPSYVVRQRHKYYLPEEIIEELRALHADDNESASPQSIAANQAKRREKLARIEDDCPAEWRNRPETLAAFGRAYAEFAEFERAAGYYSAALAADAEDDGCDVEGKVRLKLVEQLANCEVRWGEKTRDPKRILSGIRRLEALLSIAETGERWALLGSAYKRLASAATTARAPARKKLAQAADAYYRAWKRKPEDHYYALNYLALRRIGGDVAQDIDVPREPNSRAETMKVVDYLTEVADRLRTREAQSGNYWTAVVVPETKVLAMLYKCPAHSKDVEVIVNEIVELYRQAETRYGVTPRERDSALSQLRLFVENLPDGKERRAVRGILAQLTSS